MKMLIFEVNEFQNHPPHCNALLNMNASFSSIVSDKARNQNFITR